MQTFKVLYFAAPKRVEIREETLPALKDDEVLVESVCSAVSAGTEMLAYRGEIPQLADARDSISSNLKYPMKYGYACAGIVQDVGTGVGKEWLGRRVFAFQPHASRFIASPSSLHIVPDSLSLEAACFFPNMETAVNLVQDGAPILGERVLVLGLGIVGLLTSALLSEFPLAELETRDLFPLRKRAFENWKSERRRNFISGGASEEVASGNRKEGEEAASGNHKEGGEDIVNEASPSSDYAQKTFDLVFELSGSPAALNDAIRHTAFSGRIVVGSWYGEKRAPIDLGGVFHRSRIKILSSQVSSISPELSARWDKQRRAQVVWEALARLRPETWITRRFPIERAAEAYQLLNENPQDILQILFEY